jgi:hypothetical protein
MRMFVRRSTLSVRWRGEEHGLSGATVLMGFRKEKSVEGIMAVRLRNKSVVFGESWLSLIKIVMNGMRLSGVLGSLVPTGSV